VRWLLFIFLLKDFCGNFKQATLVTRWGVRPCKSWNISVLGIGVGLCPVRSIGGGAVILRLRVYWFKFRDMFSIRRAYIEIRTWQRRSWIWQARCHALSHVLILFSFEQNFMSKCSSWNGMLATCTSRMYSSGDLNSQIVRRHNVLKSLSSPDLTVGTRGEAQINHGNLTPDLLTAHHVSDSPSSDTCRPIFKRDWGVRFPHI